MTRHEIEGVELTLAAPSHFAPYWLDHAQHLMLLEAAWLRVSDDEPPLNPRLVGPPGVGKTTLACAVAQRLERPLYIFQCTTDTRPEDLLVTPVLDRERRVSYRASSVVSAMLTGGVVVLDEANRMPERSWASLAPLMDERRCVDSVVAGVRIAAHPDFCLCVTMNDDSSTHDLPAYIQTRLKPRIEVTRPPWSEVADIIRRKAPEVDAQLMGEVLRALRKRYTKGDGDSLRDMVSLARYARNLQAAGATDAVEQAISLVLEGK